MNTTTKDTKAIQQQLKAWKFHSGSWLKIAVGLGLLSGLLLILQAWLLANVVSDVLFREAQLADVQVYLLGMLLVFALRAGLAWASEQAAFHAAIQVKLYLRDQLYRHVQKLGPAWLSGERSGDVLNALSDGIEGLEAYYARYIPAMSLMTLVPLAILVFVFAHDWLAGLIMVATAPLIPFFMIIIGKGTEKRNQKQWKNLAKMSAHFLDVIQGLTTLKLFNASRREAKMVAKISEEYRESTMSVLRVAFLSSFMLEFLATVSIALVAVSIGFRLFWGEMDFYYGFFVLLLAPEFYLPLRNMGTQYHARMEAIGAGERIIEILNTPANLEQNTIATDQSSPLPSSAITIRNLSFTYPDGREAINNLNVIIPAGKTVALVGTSGAGKSTLLNLLMGFLQPSSGEITLGSSSLQTIPPPTMATAYCLATPKAPIILRHRC
jgi:ATP-binding cassette subfamily C protein CydD